MHFPAAALLLLATTALASPLSLLATRQTASTGPFIVTATPVSATGTSTGSTLPGTLFPQLNAVYAQNRLYAGNIKFHPASEIVLLQGGNASGGFSFLSHHSSPTGTQRLFAFTPVQGATQPLGFTIPHSGAVPEGATIVGFGITPAGLITFASSKTFLACPVPPETLLVGAEVGEGAYQIEFKGAGGSIPQGCLRVNLKVHAVGEECAGN